MDIVIKAKHWQIFGTLVLIASIQSMTQDIFPIAGAILYMILIFINIGWILLLGYGLSRRQKKLDSIQFKTFTWTGILLIIVVSLLRLLMTTGIIEMGTKNSTVLTVLFVIYFIISTVIIFTYPAKTLKLLETKDEIDINDYFGDIFRLLFWPIGIWTIQPRINKLIEFKTD